MTESKTGRNTFIITSPQKENFSLQETEQGWTIEAQQNRGRIHDFLATLCIKAKLRTVESSEQFFSNAECALIIKYFRLQGFDVERYDQLLINDLKTTLALLLPEFSQEETDNLISNLSYHDRIEMVDRLNKALSSL